MYLDGNYTILDDAISRTEERLHRYWVSFSASYMIWECGSCWYCLKRRRDNDTLWMGSQWKPCCLNTWSPLILPHRTSQSRETLLSLRASQWSPSSLSLRGSLMLPRRTERERQYQENSQWKPCCLNTRSLLIVPCRTSQSREWLCSRRRHLNGLLHSFHHEDPRYYLEAPARCSHFRFVCLDGSI